MFDKEKLLTAEYDKIIGWCRKRLATEKAKPFGLTGKRLEGYEEAMLSVMSYLHCEKERQQCRMS